MNEINEKVLEIITGSQLYGTATPESDKDYLGVFVPNIEYILGFRNVEEIDLSIISKDESDKNTKDAVDRKLYEIRKYMRLAMECNPNIVETLFVNEENITYINEVGREILNNRHLFPYKGLKQKFLGYAFSQKHKMIIKKSNFFDLREAYDYLSKFDDKKYIMEVAISKDCPNFIKLAEDKTHNTKFVTIGDLNILPSTVVVKTKNKIKERLDKTGNRQELILKHGFDCKFGMHAVRLLDEGIELLKTGNLAFPLKTASYLKDIRAGKMTCMKVLEIIDEKIKEMESIHITSKLKASPNLKEIERLCINILRNYV